jgi:hypothetical protein
MEAIDEPDSRIDAAISLDPDIAQLAAPDRIREQIYQGTIQDFTKAGFDSGALRSGAAVGEVEFNVVLTGASFIDPELLLGEVGDAAAATDVADTFTLSMTRDSDGFSSGFNYPGCFGTGTVVLTSQGKHPIEQVRVGQRAITARDGEPQAVEPQLDPADYRLVRLEYDEPRSGQVVEVALLRRRAVVDGLSPGDTVKLSVLELGIDDRARVVGLDRCPTIAGGAGHLITGTFRSLSPDVRLLRIDGLSEPIGVTGTHPIYSESRQKFVAVESLEAGERLQTRSGTVGVASVGRRPGNCPVFNLEIGEVHQYFVSELEVLAHNGSADVNATGGIEYSLKRPSGVTDAQWEAKLNALNKGAAEGRAKVVYQPTRTGAAQREARDLGLISDGDDADHGLDLQYGGDDTIDEIQSTNSRVNRSVGAQGRARKNYPDGTAITRFVVEGEK